MYVNIGARDEYCPYRKRVVKHFPFGQDVEDFFILDTLIFVTCSLRRTLIIGRQIAQDMRLTDNQNTRTA